MQVERGRQARPRAEHLADAPQDHGFGGLAESDDLHGTVQGQVHGIQRAGMREALQQIFEDVLEGAPLEGAARHREVRRQRDGLDIARQACGLHEAGQLRVRHVAGEFSAEESGGPRQGVTFEEERVVERRPIRDPR